MSNQSFRVRMVRSAAALAFLAAGAGVAVPLTTHGHRGQAANQAPQVTPVSVATVLSRDTVTWEAFSGRLEAIDRVAIRSRVAGAVQAVHFREGALVKAGDLLVTIDPAPYAAEVASAAARVAAAESRLALARKESDRSRQLVALGSGAISESTVDQRDSAFRAASADLHAAQAALQSAELNLSYTEIRAPVAGRVGKLEITIGNLIAAGPEAPVLTTLVSVSPIYASFSADEQAVTDALKTLAAGGPDAAPRLDLIPVEMATATHDGAPAKGRLQLIDNQVDSQSGTVRMRAVFDNADGSLIPGQFARIRMGKAKTQTVLAVNERALGTDQDKRFVIVVDADNKAVYREVTLGAAADGLRIVTSGLNPGESIVVNGLQRVRPGSLLAPQPVPMDTASAAPAPTSADAEITQR